MEQTLQALLDQSRQLYKEQKYADMVALLPDAVLEKNKNAILYGWRAFAYDELHSVDLSIEDYNKAIALNDKYTEAYYNRGLAWFNKQEFDKAIDDYTKAIETDDKYADAYYNRGLAWYNKQDYDKAINDNTKTIEIKPNYTNAFYNRGLSWYNKKVYDEAIKDYTSAITLDPKYAYAYNNRGLALYYTKDYKHAFDDYSHAIALDGKYAMAYYNRALASSQEGNFNAAINDYKTYIQLAANPDDYWTKVALSQIAELEKGKDDDNFKTVKQLVSSIKKLLLFQDDYIVHYTGLSAAKAMILSANGSPFRLSEGAFLNDTSEGRELNNFLSFSAVLKKDQETVAKPFTEKPFIGSFLTDTKFDDLTLWRMYGKEDNIEAKGCSITMNKNDFLTNLKNKVSNNDPGNNANAAVINLQTDSQFTFYKVAYITKDDDAKFIIPGSPENEKELNEVMQQLKQEVQKLNESQKLSIKELINGIAYLFKSTDYFYENEVRLVVQGVGFTKMIDTNAALPKVYIELIDIIPVIKKITLGPKVERAEEWAAAFNYKIKQQIKDANVEIVISHLPFK